jgi:predicted dehydrogenase
VGYEAPERWGTLHATTGPVSVPAEQGAYQDYYTQFAAALRGEQAYPVAAEQAVDTLAVLDAARVSVDENRTVDLLLAH